MGFAGRLLMSLVQTWARESGWKWPAGFVILLQTLAPLLERRITAHVTSVFAVTNRRGAVGGPTRK